MPRHLDPTDIHFRAIGLLFLEGAVFLALMAVLFVWFFVVLP